MDVVATLDLKSALTISAANDTGGLKDPAVPLLRFRPIVAPFTPSLGLTLSDLVISETTFSFSSLGIFSPPQINAFVGPGFSFVNFLSSFNDQVEGGGFNLFHDGSVPATVYGFALVGGGGTKLFGYQTFDPPLEFLLDSTMYVFAGDLFLFADGILK